jgi:hypothetical protein
MIRTFFFFTVALGMSALTAAVAHHYMAHVAVTVGAIGVGQ